eukprot:5800054-Pleurochrysis_carterae.AAC.3
MTEQLHRAMWRAPSRRTYLRSRCITMIGARSEMCSSRALRQQMSGAPRTTGKPDTIWQMNEAQEAVDNYHDVMNAGKVSCNIFVATID